MPKRKTELTEEEKAERLEQKRRKHREYMAKRRADQKAGLDAQMASNTSVTSVMCNEAEVGLIAAKPTTSTIASAKQTATPGLSHQMQSLDVGTRDRSIAIQDVLGSKFDSHCQVDQLCNPALSHCVFYEYCLPDMQNSTEYIEPDAITFALLKLIADSPHKIALMSMTYWYDYYRKDDPNPAKYCIAQPPLDADDDAFLLIPILDGPHFVLGVMEKGSQADVCTLHFCDSLYGSLPNSIYALLKDIFLRLFVPWAGLSADAICVLNDISRQSDKQLDGCNCAAYVVSNALSFFANFEHHAEGIYLTRTTESGHFKRLQLFSALSGMLPQSADTGLLTADGRIEALDSSASTQRDRRLGQMRNYRIEQRAAETEEQKAERLTKQKARQQKARETTRKRKVDLCGATDSANARLHRLSPMNAECLCGALHFAEERVSNKPTFNDCCNHGKVQLPSLPEYPFELKQLLTKKHKFSNEFLRNIRYYNNAHAFAAFNCRMRSFARAGPYCFTIQGQIYYELDQNVDLRSSVYQSLGQIFFSDPAEATAQRLSSNPQLKEELMQLLDEIMREYNPHAKLFMRMGEALKAQEQSGLPLENVSMGFNMRPGYDPRRYNEPTCNEIGAVFTTDVDGEIPEMDLVMQPLGELTPRRISSLSPNALPWTYPLFFPKGTLGYSPEMQKLNAKTHKRISRMQFLSYHLAVRRGRFNPLHYGEKLTQQFVVDGYVQMEADRMSWIRNNQKVLKLANYHELHASLMRTSATAGKELGRVYVLPSTCVGSPRYMRESYQDAMAIVLRERKPDIFATFTCNPKWPEIVDTLGEITVEGLKQTATDRPDIVARVFALKAEAIMDFLVKKQVLGPTQCWIFVIEFQKRGLPHIHILLGLRDGNKLLHAEEINKLCCAELPDESDPELCEIVHTTMIHRICGDANPDAPCMINKQCRFKYPKAFCAETIVTEDCYPQLRRRNNGKFLMIKNVKYDNRRVVPYNPYLSKTFNCHANVEIVATIKNVKYLYKYALKGGDAASLEFTCSGNLEHDEIKDFVDGRYVGPVEAAYRIFELPLQAKSHSVTRLPVHLENQQTVAFDESGSSKAIQAAMLKDTMLTDYFKLNERDSAARQFTYSEIPAHYCWKDSKSKDAQGQKLILHRWEARRVNRLSIGRMYAISPSQGDLWHLRLLLLHVRGAFSFNSLRTVDGTEYLSNGEACLALGLIEDDREYIKCLHEASAVLMPNKIRSLFVNILLYCNPANPETLWDMFKDKMSDDFARRLANRSLAIARAYQRIDALLRQQNKSIAHFPSMEPLGEVNETAEPLDHDQELSIGLEMYETLNAEQKAVVDHVLDVLDNGGQQKLIFIDGLGGTGKTFVYKVLCHLILGRQLNFLTCAFTGIAALLLKNGRTCHKTFGLPVPLEHDSNSTISRNSSAGRALIDSNVIIWDEAPMAPKHALHIADSKLRELMQTNELFGGKVMLLGGDFRQILPIAKSHNISDSINLSIRKSKLWPYFQQFTLTQNMRAKPEEAEFAEFLKQVGEGALNNAEEQIELPAQCIATTNLEQTIFGNLITAQAFDQMANSAILVAKHIGVNESNAKVLEMLDGEPKEYLSLDSAMETDECADKTLLLPEYLNSIEEGSLPPHKLLLKPNSIVMLLRNLSQEDGLCNGTRLLVLALHDHSVHCKILTGDKAGEEHFLPRINNTITYKNTFQLNRKQFPIKLAFAITINKSQGQTFEHVGINLEHPAFEHGQLYVALSRARCWSAISIYIPPPADPTQADDRSRLTRNIVHREILTMP